MKALKIENPETGELLGWLMTVKGSIKFVSVKLEVKAAIMAFKDAMSIHDDSEPKWDELTKEEEDELRKLDNLDNIAFLARQVY